MTKTELGHIRNKAYKLMASSDPLHDISHIERVKDNALKIARMKELNKEETFDLKLLEAMCLVHDLSYVYYKTGLKLNINENKLIAKILPEFLAECDISDKDKKSIINAASKHSHSYPFKKLNKKEDLYTQILQDADTLDLFHEKRVENFKEKITRKKLLKPAGKITDIIINHSKKNIHKYLNMPEIVEKFHFCECGKKNNEIILCLPGYRDSPDLFKKFARKISKKYHVYSLDYPMNHHKRKVESIESLTNFVDLFVKSCGLKKFTLIGFSFGGAVATNYTYKNQDRVTRLLILNSSPKFLTKPVEKYVYKIIKRPLRTNLVSNFFYLVNTSDQFKKMTKRPALKPESKTRLKKFRYSIYQTLFNNLGTDLTNELNEIKIPKTIVAFKDDEVVKWKKYHKFLSSLNCEIKVFENGGHATKKEYWNNISNLVL